MPQIFLEITIKPFHSQKYLQNRPLSPGLALNPSLTYHFMRQTTSDQPETLPRHS